MVAHSALYLWKQLRACVAKCPHLCECQHLCEHSRLYIYDSFILQGEGELKFENVCHIYLNFENVCHIYLNFEDVCHIYLNFENVCHIYLNIENVCLIYLHMNILLCSQVRIHIYLHTHTYIHIHVFWEYVPLVSHIHWVALEDYSIRLSWVSFEKNTLILSQLQSLYPPSPPTSRDLRDFAERNDAIFHIARRGKIFNMGWLWLVGSIKF